MIIAERSLLHLDRDDQSRKHSPWPLSLFRSLFLSPFLSLSPIVWGTTLCALVTILPSSKWGIGGVALSIVAVLAQLISHIAWLPRDVTASQHLPPVVVDTKAKVAADLCPKVVMMLIVAMGFQTLLFGFPPLQITRSLLTGVMKGMFWFFILQTVRGGVPGGRISCTD